mgnify:CR=1 FL=1
MYNSKMKLYTGTFVKKNGDHRDMKFIRLEDLPKNFLESKVIGIGKANTYTQGMELVFDIEENNFRVFNWNTIIKKPKIEEFSIDLFESLYT